MIATGRRFEDEGSTPYERFCRYLETHGKRLTRERAAIMTEVFSCLGPFAPDELVGRLKLNCESRVSRSTVYRTVNELHEAGLLRRQMGPDDVEYYEPI